MHSIDNTAFLQAVFRETAGIWIASFPGDPNDGQDKGRKWKGRLWDGKTIAEKANNYFCIASIAENNGSMQRRKTHFGALHCLVLDDLGTKADMKQIGLLPSWVLETSHGNCQCGFILHEPLADPKLADALIKAVVATGRLSDTGGQNICRYMRLPQGWNAKATVIKANGEQPFQCRLLDWRPGSCYSLQELVDGLELDIKLHQPEHQRHKNKALVVADIDDEEFYTPRQQENPVIVALKNANLYKNQLSDGKHDITCPWLDEHTDKVDHGTAYFEPDASYLLGGFKCQHGHCQSRQIKHLLEFLDINRLTAKNRPIIRVIGGALSQIIDTCEKLLADTGQFFQQGGAIVRVMTGPDGQTKTVCVNHPTMTRHLTDLASWQKKDKRSKEWAEIDAPGRYAQILLDSPDYRHLVQLTALARQPFLRCDGSLYSATGYDSKTGIFGVFDTQQFNIPPHPNRAQALTALELLTELLSEIAFKSSADKSAVLSAILTATVRSSLPAAPGFLATSNVYGGGKSYLLDMIALFATSLEPAAATFINDEDEMRKQLLATLLDNAAVVKFDEMKCNLVPVKCLLSALTAQQIEGRVLGVSRIVRPSTRTLMLFAGNNVMPVADMSRRIVPIMLDPKLENPFTRVFQKNPLMDIKQNRERYVAAALTIIRAWLCAGSPRTEVKPLNGFEAWANWCRQPQLWLEQPDPCEAVFTSMAQDPEREMLGAFLQVWQDCFGQQSRMVREMVAYAENNSDEKAKNLYEMLCDIFDGRNGIDKQKLGNWIKKRAGQIVNGLRFEKDAGRKRNADSWRVTIMTGTLQKPDKSDESDSLL
jgi:hypothetical protein